MKQGMLLVLVLCACGPKGSPKTPGSTTPPDAAPATATATAKITVNDPSIACDGSQVGYTVKLGFADGCAAPDAMEELDLMVDTHPLGVSYAGALDLGTFIDGFEPKGCGAHITMKGDSGVLALEFSPSDAGSQDLSGSGTWTPAGGAACAVTVTGDYDSIQ